MTRAPVPSAPPAPRPSGGRMALRAAITVLVFALLAPFAGALVVILGMMAYGFRPVSMSNVSLAGTAVLFYGFWLAYPLGFVPAAINGVLVAAIDAFRRGTTLLVAALIGLASGAVWGLVLNPRAGGNRFFDGLAVAATVLATILCWWLTRPWGRKRREVAA